ncbi:DUF4038 domain-containing protein [Candidatus Poribacteria bacterium]|nr:DUF4038 domain-containing protein [Candidatus Poribacteria bacterium]
MLTAPKALDVGPIRVSGNGRYFLDQNDRPFFWLGDTQWELFRSFTLAEAETILENRSNKGFTAIQVMLTGVGDGTKPNLAGQTPWINNNPDTPNENYFKQVDSVIQLGRQTGLVLVLGVFHQLQTTRITPVNARTYAKWLAQRYRNVPNIIWTMYPKAEHQFIPVVRELAAGLQEGDRGTHLITVHPDPSPASSSFIHNESWLSFNMIQTWAYYERIYEMVTKDYNLAPTKPVIMAEGAYESGSEYGFPVTPLMVRKQAYWSYMAGGHHSYGHNDSWRLLPTWKSALDAPGAFQMGVLKKIFTAREWWNLVPNQSIFAGQESQNTMLNTAVQSQSGDWAMAYLSSQTSVSINLNKITAGSEVEASWLDPRTGTQTRIGNFPNTGIRSFSTPVGWEDAVLRLEKST